MAMRPRTPTSRVVQPSPRPVYEKFQPKSEMKENEEAYLLNVYLPGFVKERIRINFVSSSRILRVIGERPIDSANIRWSRFEQTYPVPENCEVEKLEGKFERGTLIITMPKKFISKVTTPRQAQAQAQAQMEKTTKEKAQSPPSKKAQEPNISSPKPPTTRVDPPIIIGDRDKKIHQNNVQEETWNKPQKGEEVIEPKRAFSMDPIKQIEEKRQEEIRQKTILQTVKKQLHDEKEKSVTKKEVKEENIGNKPNESIRKKQEKYIDPNMVLKEKEIKARKESPKATKSNSDSKGSETVHKAKRKEDENYSTIGKGIKELAASALEVINKIGEGKLDEKDKPLVANMGAAILVIVAFGAYVTYKFTSSSGRT